MPAFSFVCVDFQKEFTDPSGNFYIDRPMVGFTRNKLIPELVKKKYKVGEIVADYRQPRHGDKNENCVPGTSGFESDIPAIIKKEPWVKAMNSPLWTRKNAGLPKKTGWPYIDAHGFDAWLKKNAQSRDCFLFGLTLDRCLFCVAQELSFRGYNVSIIREACDTYSGSPEEKELLFKTAPVTNWAKAVSWNTVKKKI